MSRIISTYGLCKDSELVLMLDGIGSGYLVKHPNK